MKLLLADMEMAVLSTCGLLIGVGILVHLLGRFMQVVNAAALAMLP